MAVRIAPLIARTVDDFAEEIYDAALVSVGYEQRSSALARVLREKPTMTRAVEFDGDRNEVFEENRDFYEREGWELSEDWGEGFERLAVEFFEEQRGGRILVDVSSMTRWRIAAVVAALEELEIDADITVDLVYLPAVYIDPPDPPAAILRLKPASTFFSGSLDSRGATTCILGLGYEPEKAAATIEALEPSEVIAFVPIDTGDEYTSEVEKANQGLLSGRMKVERIDYDVDDPYGCFVVIEQLVNDLIADGKRPALVPMGPKIFAAVCLLVGSRHQDEASVWRASFRGAEDPIDHVAKGDVFGLRISVGNGPI